MATVFVMLLFSVVLSCDCALNGRVKRPATYSNGPWVVARKRKSLGAHEEELRQFFVSGDLRNDLKIMYE